MEGYLKHDPQWKARQVYQVQKNGAQLLLLQGERDRDE
jgi:hypothetical protein